MARTLTSSDRKSLIRLASSLPKGSPERRAILAGLKQGARGLNVDGLSDDEVRKAIKRLPVGTPLFKDGKAYGITITDGIAFDEGALVVVRQFISRGAVEMVLGKKDLEALALL